MEFWLCTHILKQYTEVTWDGSTMQMLYTYINWSIYKPYSSWIIINFFCRYKADDLCSWPCESYLKYLDESTILICSEQWHAGFLWITRQKQSVKVHSDKNPMSTLCISNQRVFHPLSNHIKCAKTFFKSHQEVHLQINHSCAATTACNALKSTKSTWSMIILVDSAF
jgi:hypothetical protein